MNILEWAPHYIAPCNIKTGDHYCHYDGAEQFLVRNNLLMDGGDFHIQRHPRCAETFLSAIRNRELELNNQIRYLELLDTIHHKIRMRRAGFENMAPLFLEALEGLKTLANGILQEAEDYIADPISERFGPAGDWGVITETLHCSRTAAVAGMFIEFARQYSREEGFQGDFFGESWIELSNPQDPDIAKQLEGTFRYFDFDQAIIKKSAGSNHWRLDFFQLVPMPNRLMLEKAALDHAALIISKGLCLETSVEYSLRD